MLVSVVIPVFGRQKSLEYAVKSVTRQTGLGKGDVEIIIVDDYSPVPIMAPPGIENLKLVRLTQNAGAAGARNAGISSSQGEFIAFLDSDDSWQPDKLSKQLDLAKQIAKSRDLQRIAIACGFYTPNRFDRQLELRIPREASQLNEFLGGCWMCPGSTLFLHRSVFEKTGGLDQRLRRLEDYEWMMRFAAGGGQLCVSRGAGAVIAPSAGPKLAPVREAIRIIKDTVANSKEIKLSPAERRTFESYLELEMTAACLGERRRLQAAYHLLKSVTLKPRLQPSTSDFWERSSQIPNDVISTYEKLAANAE